MTPLTQSKKTTILPVLIALMLACFALSPQAQAVIPVPDGGYPNENTAEGENASSASTRQAAPAIRPSGLTRSLVPSRGCQTQP
jgi:hypothetical protein